MSGIPSEFPRVNESLFALAMQDVVAWYEEHPEQLADALGLAPVVESEPIEGVNIFDGVNVS